MPKSISERPDTQLTAEPALEKRTRRQLTPEYKLRIIADEEKMRQKTAKTYPGKPSSAGANIACRPLRIVYGS